ncbi:MAG: class I SAM-dependent methyltransferase [Polaribacter sp.]|uniref:class I SAM-dependent methyltransferase n=1 Tax=Polaribacter sp. TaxID=1920175 RepID=UPI0032673DE8
MMKNLEESFTKGVAAILTSKTIKEEIIAVDILIDNYKTLFSDLFISNSIIDNKETITNGGIALSLEHARDCLEDPIRTARFLKGIYKAILVAQDRFVDKKISILYAGCGPLGTLIIPLLHLFSWDEIEVILLDIHETSIDAVKKNIKKLEYEAYIKEYLVADATKYKHQKEGSLQMIITETMDKALTNEPQVEITRNLGNQLAANGIFIPEKIEIQKGYSFFAKEFIFNPKEGGSKLNQKELKVESCNTEKLFSITKKIESLNLYSFETDWISIPTNFEKAPDICLYTSVQVFDDVFLNKSESLITNPYCVKSLYSLKTKRYKLQYTTKEMSTWKLIE